MSAPQGSRPSNALYRALNVTCHECMLARKKNKLDPSRSLALVEQQAMDHVTTEQQAVDLVDAVQVVVKHVLDKAIQLLTESCNSNEQQAIARKSMALRKSLPILLLHSTARILSFAQPSLQHATWCLAFTAARHLVHRAQEGPAGRRSSGAS